MTAIDIDKVIDAFNNLAEKNIASDNPYFCLSAAESVQRSIKENCDVLSNMNALCYAAGCEAYYRYLLTVSADETAGFKAGDITVESTTAETVENAKKLVDLAFSDIATLLKPKRFAFRKA